jgi:uncharacterized cupredoxin-like copper-binding protein
VAPFMFSLSGWMAKLVAPSHHDFLSEVQHTDPAETEIDPRYRNFTCYNCGESGILWKFVTNHKVCFICVIPGH